jgi:hypothetical protein
LAKFWVKVIYRWHIKLALGWAGQMGHTDLEQVYSFVRCEILLEILKSGCSRLSTGGTGNTGSIGDTRQILFVSHPDVNG